MVWEEAGMDFSHKQQNPARNVTGIGMVIALHLLVGYFVVSGMGKQLIDKIKNPVETKIIEEVKPPPPKDLPPPPPPPEVKAPPPPFIPPPEVVTQAQPQPNTIATVTNVQPATNQLPKTPVVAPVVESKAPPAPPARTAPVLSVAECQKPEYPRSSARNEEEGAVTIAFLIGTDGRVKDSKIEQSSGHRELDKAAVTTLSSCNKFKAGTVDGKPVEAWGKVIYVWKIPE
jgi:protein TonB